MRLSPEYLPATGGAQQDLVLLHGWGANRDIWRPLLTQLRPWANITLLDLPGCASGLAPAENPDLGGIIEAVLACCPASAVYLGWSLGGQLAVELAARHAGRVSAVVTLCSNPKFVAAGDWPGMQSRAFRQFKADFETDPAATLRRFDSLQAAGSENPRALLRRLRDRRGAAEGTDLLQGLGWLEELDQRAVLPTLQPPQMHLLAEHDGLVPPALVPALAKLLADKVGARVETLAGSSHLAPLECGSAVALKLREFLAAEDLLRTAPAGDGAPAKRDVATSFSRAAESYDSVAHLQRDVGERLLARLQQGDRSPSLVLDLGCGTGFFRSRLLSRYPRADYIGLDLAPGMVEYARTRAGEDDGWIVGDAESLPLANDSVDLVFSSLAIQWCYRPELLFAELARVLKPGGICAFSTLGPGTLIELRSAWASVDAHQHVNSFTPPAELISAAARIPGIRLATAGERYCMEYARVGELLAELKSLGAHNMNRNRPTGLTSRKTLQGMVQSYEARRVNGFLPATYDVIFGEVRKL